MSSHKKYGFYDLKRGAPLPAVPGLVPNVRRSALEGLHVPEEVHFVDPSNGEVLSLDLATARFGKFLILLALFLPACVGWTKRDTAREVGFVAATTLDWRQTRTITSYCNEGNPIIGPCGENISPDVYFPATIVVHAVVAALLPPGPWRTTWMAAPLGAEASQTWGNYRSRYWDPANKPLPTPPLLVRATVSAPTGPVVKE